MAKRDLNSQQLARKTELKSRLAGLGVLGHTRRDQLVYEAIDEYLAKEPQIADPQERSRLRENTKQKVRDIWLMASWNSLIQ